MSEHRKTPAKEGNERLIDVASLETSSIHRTAGRIRALLERSGLTQAEAARRAGLQRDAFGRYLLGRTRAPSRKLVAIARVFGVPPSDLDPGRAELDVIIDTDPAPCHAYTLTPATGGLVRLEFSADMPIDMAMRIIKVLNGDDGGKGNAPYRPVGISASMNENIKE